MLPYRRYHHLILRQAENGCWLGLPGEYSEEEEAEAQRFGFREFAAWMETGATGWLFWRRKVEKVRIFVYTHSDIFGNFRRKGTAA